MNKFFLFAGLIIFLCAPVWGADYTWTGAVDATWIDADNWVESGTGNIPADPPEEGDSITINAAAPNYPTVPDTITTFDSVTINDGTLTLDANLAVTTLTITGTATIDGFAITTVNLSAVDNAVFAGDAEKEMNGVTTLTVAAGSISLDGVNGTTGILTAGSKNVLITTDSANTDIDIGDITNTGNIDLTLNGQRGLTTNSNNFTEVTITITGNITLDDDLSTADLTNNGTLNLDSNTVLAAILINNGRLDLGDNDISVTSITNNGTIILEGNTSQIQITPPLTSIGGTVEYNGSGATPAGITSFNNLIIAAGGTLTVTGNISITGDLTINGTLEAGTVITIDGGTWNNAGTFTHNDGTVAFIDATVNGDNNFYNVITSGVVSFLGSNTFNDLDCTGTVNFAGGSTQTVNGIFSAIGATLSGATHWRIENLTSATFITNASTVISYCDSQNYLGLTNANATDGGNNLRVFVGGTFTWQGSVSNAWNNDANWVEGYYPLETDAGTEITIPAGYTYQPVLNMDVICGELTINTGAVVDLTGFTLSVETVNGLTNNGTIRLHGVADQVTVGGTAQSGSDVGGTINYYNSPPNNQWVFGNDYVNLTVESTANMAALTSQLTVSGNATIASSINAASVDITGTSIISANITTTGGTQDYNGTVTLGADVTLEGTTVTLGQITGNGNTLTITGNAVLNGGSGINELSVSGMSEINVDISSTGNQTYTGDVTLGANVTFTGNGSLVLFESTVDGAYALTVTTANAQFNEAVGGTNPLSNVSVAGTSLINADITTSGNQTYTGAVTLGGAGTRTFTGATITFGQITNGNNLALMVIGNAILNGGSDIDAITITQNATFQSNPLSAASVEVIGASTINADITTTGNQSYAAVNFGSPRPTLISDGGSVTASGIVSGTTGVIIMASQGITMNNTASNLSGNVELYNNEGTPANAVSFITTGAVTITGINDVGNFDITANGITVAGITAAGQTVSLTSTANIAQSGAINAQDLVVNGATGIALNSANTVTNSAALTNSTSGGISLDNTSASLALTARNDAVAGTITVTQNGTLDVTGTGVSTNNGEISLTTINGDITGPGAISGNVVNLTTQTSGNISSSGTITGTNINLTSVGNISISGVINGTALTAAASSGITLNAANTVTNSAALTNSTSGNISLDNTSASLELTARNDAVAGTITVTQNGTLDVTGTGVSTNNGEISLTATGGNITGTGAISGNIVNLTTQTSGNISSSGTITGTNINLTSVGNINISGVINGTALTAAASSGITLNAANMITNSAALTNGTGNISLNNASGGTLELSAQNTNGNITVTQRGNLIITAAGINTSTTGIVILETNYPGAGSNNITISGNINAGTLSLILGSPIGDPGGTLDQCGDLVVNSTISVNGTINIETGTITNTGSITSTNGSAISILLDDASAIGSLGNITPAPSIGPRHGGTATDLVYYSTSLPSSVGGYIPADAVFINSDAYSNSNSFNLTGFRNVYIANVSDASNRTVTINAGGFIVFYSDAGSSSYNYSGVNTNHLTITAATDIFSYHSSSGVTVINLNNSGFTASQPIIIEQGSLSITASGISVDTINGTAGQNNHLTLNSPAANINAAGGLGTTVRLGDITVTNAANAQFNGTVTANSFTQNAGTGTTTFESMQNYTNAFAFTGNNLTLNNTLTTTGGSVTISNNGTFTQNAVANITSAGFFNQTTAGTSDISASITAAGNISFSGAVVISGAASTMNSSSANGNITLMDTLAGTGDLTLIAGTGNVSVTGNIGVNNTTRLGNLNVESATDVNFSGNVYAGNITVNNTGVYTQGGSVVNASGYFDQTGSGNVILSANISANTAIEFTAPSLSLSNDVTFSLPAAGGSIVLSENVSGDRILTLSGGSTATHISLSRRTAGLITVNGNITIAANSYVTVTGAQVYQDGTARSLTLLENAVLDTSSSYWHMGSQGVTDDFYGSSGTLNLYRGSNLINNVLNLTSGSFTVNNNNFTDGFATISVKGDANITDVVFSSNYPRLVIEMTGTGNQNLVTGRSLGSLHVIQNSRTNLQNDLEIHGEVKIISPAVLNAAGNNIVLYAGLSETKHGLAANVGRWIIEGVGEYDPISNIPNITASSQYGFMQNFNNSVEFKREQTGSTNNIFFEILGNTTWQNFICDAPGVTFEFSTHPDQHVFLHTFHIQGTENNKITLTRYVDDKPAGWLYIYDNISIPPSTPIYNSQGLPMAPPSRNLKNEPEEEKEKFWNINLIPSGSSDPLMEIFGLRIYFSHAWYQRIPVSTEEMKLDAIPFYRDSDRDGYFNYDWVEVRRIIYSYVEDANGNGKVDRIRVQTNVPLNGNFSKFMVSIDGFEVDTSRGSNGFDVLSNVLSSTNPEHNYSFYIYLKEGQYLYDGQPIRWYVIENDESLMDNISKQLLVGEPSSGEIYYTINTIPPRVSYTVTLPGYNNTYVRMSQPVSFYSRTDSNNGISGDRISTAPHNNSAQETVPPPDYSNALIYYTFNGRAEQHSLSSGYIPSNGVLAYLLRLNAAPSVADIAGFPRIGEDPQKWFFELGELRDSGVRALDWNDPRVDPSSYMYYPSPSYPVDWKYSDYLTYPGNSHAAGMTSDSDAALSANITIDESYVFLPPNRVLTPEMIKALEEGVAITPSDFASISTSGKRRITDVLVSIPPTDTESTGYFAWPVWARYKDTSRHPELDPGGLFWGQDDTDDGIIWEFDGTKYLQDRDIILQARVNGSALQGLNYNGLSLFYGFNVPAEWRDPKDAGLRGRGSGGLWLPRVSNPLFNIVPTALIANNGMLGHYPAVQAPVTPSRPFFTFDLLKETGGFSSGGKLDFLLRLNVTGADPNLFIARLDPPDGADISRIEWWTMIRPFSFDIQDVRLQRGGVTVLNNVINSENRETAYIRYHLVRSGRVTIQVYTLDGTLVKSIRRNEHREAGEWTDAWDGSNNGGRAVARGLYFVRVVAPDIDEIRKIMVVK